ncbi:MAG: hypothetical protein KAS63_07285 [Candidatus Heimdallarchaeota archaeon]|nr:hypothetical protein [Candidatus Heimdallarchaeota archaeon]MCK4955150.1 hypothetical protein [Candidatus Heimdallarchaeota archaeon]
MTKLWGDTTELSDFTKKNLEAHLERILKDKGRISFRELIKEIWQPYHLLTHFIRIKVLISQLEGEGKIIVDKEENISIARLSYLDTNGFQEVSIWDLEHRKKEVEKKKEIIRRYQNINYLS